MYNICLTSSKVLVIRAKVLELETIIGLVFILSIIIIIEISKTIASFLVTLNQSLNRGFFYQSYNM